MITINEIKADRGEKIQFELKPCETYSMPATLIRGSKPGKNVLVCAGTHSSEYPGIPALIRVAEKLDPMKIHGDLLFIHCVNTSGFKARNDSIVPEDEGNLNRDLPGNVNGTLTQQIAAYFAETILPQMDFCIDLHSGSLHEDLTPCIFFPKEEKISDEVLSAAKSTDIPYLIASENNGGIIGYAGNILYIPALLLERGGKGECRPEWVREYEKDIYRLFTHLGVFGKQNETEKHKHTVFEEAIYLEADCEGLWYPNVHPDMTIKSGDLLGHIEDMYGHNLREYKAEKGGIVMYHTISLAINRNDPLVAYVIKKE